MHDELLRNRMGDASTEDRRTAIPFEPCQFPGLKSAVDEQGSSGWVPVQFISDEKLQRVYSAHGVEPQELLQVSWGILLRAYTASDYPAFRYFKGDMTQPATRDDHDHDGLICSLDLSENDEPRRLVDKMRFWDGSWLEDAATQLNTALSWNRRTECSSQLHVSLESFGAQTARETTLRYWTPLLTKEQALDVADLLQHIVDQLLQCPKWQGIDLCSPRSFQQLSKWNSTPRERVKTCAHYLVLRQCVSQPNAPAVCAWDGDFTYGEVDRLSSIMAHNLVRSGVGPETFVAVYLDKSRWTTITILGVMRAGGAFLLLDVGLPEARLRGMCQKLGVHCVVTAGHLTDSAVLLSSCVVTIDGIETQHCETPPPTPPEAVAPHNALFAVFTSGSTGAPKGAILTHESYCSGQKAVQDTYGLDTNTRMLQFSSHAFDLSIHEHLNTLICGGCVCIPSETSRKSNLVDVILDLRVNAITLTPTVARLVPPADVPAVTTVIMGGEPLRQTDVETWVGQARVINLYGPAECSIVTSARIVTNGDDCRVFGSGNGALCWIADPTDPQKLAPVGAIGELLIDGPIVGRGYVGDLDKTENTFIASPQWRQAFPGADARRRLYRTGDIVRYVADGNVKYIGRKDTQVKLHGQRVELAEIEHQILNILAGETEEVVVDLVTPADSPASSILAVFVRDPTYTREVRGSKSNDDVLAPPCQAFRAMAQSLLDELACRVPHYMVPAAVIPLTRMPTSVTGKTDRRRLKEMVSQLTRRALETFTREAVENRSPGSPMEVVLSGLIEKVLGVNKSFGMNDSFFALGGDSIQAMRLAHIARREAGVDVSATSVLQAPVLADLALTMRTASTVDGECPPPFALLGDEMSCKKTLQEAQRGCGLASRDEIEDAYPCTPLQQGMMALSTTSPTAKYVTRSVFRLDPEVDLDRLQRAWNTVIQLNPILRTRIVQLTGSDQAIQVVVRGDPSWVLAHSLEDYIERDTNTRIEFGKPLLRLAVAVTNSFRYLIFTIHHALYDGWTLSRIVEQVESAYMGQIPNSVPFSLFLSYQLRLNLTEMENFWHANLAGFSGTLFPGAPSMDYRPAHVQTMQRSTSIDFPKDLGVTTATVITLAWALTLSQHSGCDDVVFGMVHAGRNVPLSGIDEIMGPTLATIPQRVRLQRSMRALDMLRQLQRDSAAALPFEHLGLQRIGSLGPEAAAACRFQNLLIIQPTQDDGSSLIFEHPVEEYSAEIIDTYVLTLEAKLARNNDTLVESTYDPSVISESLMHGIMNQFVHNIDQLTNRAHSTLQNLWPISPTDFQTIQTWNSHVPDTIPGCVHEWIQQQCLEQAEEAAVIAWDGSLTYGELEKESTRMAAHLQALGVGPGAFIAVGLGKSVWTAMAVVAVMKAGAAFVLLDFGQPANRLHRMCQNTQATVVITSDVQMSKAREMGLHVFNTNDTSRWKPPPAFQQPNVTPSDPVYAVFTSGSTGQPKGIVIEHRALLTSAVLNGRRQSMNRDSRVLQLASFTFDVSVLELLHPLVHGGCVCVPTEAETRNDLEMAMNEYSITWATTTPSLARTLNPSRLSTLRTLVLGGEAMAAIDIQMWAGHVELINSYGPAECTIDAVIQRHITPDCDPRNIGEAVAAVSWVVDPHDSRRLNPIGAVGELLIEGPILARGYLNDPDKTAASFIEYPDWLRCLRRDQPGRLYRTGDLVQYDPKGDGSLLYVGRLDNQVKIRGQRLELGEVQHHLRVCLPEAREIVADVIKSSNAGAQPILVAFVLWKDAGADSAAADSDSLLLPVHDQLLSQAENAVKMLQSRVPSYMIPSFFLPFNRIPFSPSGKVDRRLLRDEVSKLSRRTLQSYTGSVAGTVAPATEGESILQHGVAQLLKVERAEVGMQENFFRLGGDSITAIRLVGHLRERGFTLTVAELFQHPCLADLAPMVRRVEPGNQMTPIPPFSLLSDSSGTDMMDVAVEKCRVDRDCIEDIYPATPMQEALLALSMKDPNAYIGKFVYQISPATDIDRLQSAWQAVFHTNPILRTRIVQVSNATYQVVLRDPPHWDQDELHLQVGYGKSLIQIGIRTHEANGSQQLHLLLHHALYDGVSLPGFLQQVEDAYNGIHLPLRPFTPFVAFTATLDAAACQQFWMSEFEDLDATMFPSANSSRTGISARESVSHTIALPPPKEGDFTLPTMIHLACASVFGHYNASDDVIYGVTVSGRNAPVHDIEHLSGSTIATILFRVQFSSMHSVRDGLRQIQNHLIRLIPYEQTGLQNIRSYSAETAAACDFHCQLIIQPADDDREISSSLLLEQDSTSHEVYSNFASYPLVLLCTLSSDRRVHLVMNFDSSLLTCRQIAALSHQLDHILQQIVRDQDQSLAALEFVSAQDQRRLAEYNKRIPARVNRLLHELVSEQCAASPTMIAVDSWDGVFSYQVLIKESTRVARHLRAIGASAHPVTAICMEKSRWTIVAILAVLQIGSACVLIDSAHPRARIQSMLVQAAVKWVIVSHGTREIMEDITADVVVMSSSLGESSSPIDLNTVREINPRHPAFIVFTSGSTGKPKGTVLEHASLATALRDLHHPAKLDGAKNTLHFASYAFDMSIFEIFGSLLAGCCLCIPSESERMSNLSGFIEHHRVDWACMVPSAVVLLQPLEVPSLRTLISMGEPLTRATVEQWAGKLSLINGYGPAECSFLVAMGPVPATDWVHGDIGPMVNGVGWITNPFNPSQLVAWGAVGELLVEGPILAREYIGDYKQTAASFIASPRWLTCFRGRGKSCLYRTGDLVQYNDDGSLRYVGRQDRQLKVNGQRIELGDVESHLARCLPAGSTVIVEIIESSVSKRRPHLCAFISSGRDRPDQPVVGAVTKDFLDLALDAKMSLSASLPRYMIPEVFYPLNRVPITASGKINRRLLCVTAASLEAGEIDRFKLSSSNGALPSTAIEITLVGLWAELLDVPADRIGLHDAFFHLGGDSILAMKLATLAQQRGLTLAVSDIFSNPRLSDMAAIVKPTEASTKFQKDIPPFALLDVDVKDLVLNSAVQQCSVERDQIEDIYPCTPLQEGLLSLSMRKPGAYLADFGYFLPDEIDLARFHSAWEAVAHANPILRSRIIHNVGGLFQTVVRDVLPWLAVDNLDEYVASLSRRDMQLGQPLVHLAHCQSEFVLVIHHALYDGWSLPLIWKQVDQAYQGQNLAICPFNRFVDYIARSDFTASQEYWASQLVGLSATVFPSLPSSDYHPTADSNIKQTIPLQALPGITKGTMLQLAWSMALSHYIGSNDVLFGVLSSGRQANLAGIETLSGPALATVPLRFCLNKDQYVSDELHRLQQQVTSMIPFEQFGLQNIRRLGDDAKAACRFQNLLVIQATATDQEEYWTPQPRRAGLEKFTTYAVEVTCSTAAKETEISVDFDPRIVDPRRANRILSHFGHLVQQIQLHPTRKLSNLEILDPCSHRQIMEWNAVAPEAVDQLLPDGIEQRCLATPDAPAVCAWDGEFTYRELRELSSRLATHLEQLGIGPDIFVPIIMQKSCWVAVAILGVIKAGGAIVLLDPKIPVERMRTTCREVDALITVISAECTTIASSLSSTTVVTLGHDHLPPMQDQPASATSLKARTVGPKSAIYAIFTSGSTGKPKGIVVEHGAYYHAIMAQKQAMYMESTSRTLQFTSHVFDPCIGDYFGTFLTGGCLCIASGTSLKDDLKGVINDYHINRVDLTPSLARVLRPEDVPTLQTLILGGEAMTGQDVQTWADKLRLVNCYGPSEASVNSSLTDVSLGSDPANIGFASGCVSWIVDKDDHNRLVPVGAPGELVLEGPILAKGYLHEPEKTAAVFIESTPPWLRTLRPNSRLYKTGDLVEYDANGSLRYIGRKDTQVKIRGQRVELGEIEQQILQAAPAVSDVVVELIAPSHQKTGPVLAAFVHHSPQSKAPPKNKLFGPPNTEHRVMAQQAVREIQKRLPSYMVPTLFIPLASMPLMVSGKVDRRLINHQASALTRTELEAFSTQHLTRRAPSTSTEAALQHAAAETLQCEDSEVGMDDDFFGIGGDSIIAIRFVAKARELGFTFRVTDVFQTPRLSELAQYATIAGEDTKCPGDIPEPEVCKYMGFTSRQDLIHAVWSSRSWLFPKTSVVDILPVPQSLERMAFQPPEHWCLNLQGSIDYEQLQRACTALVQRHSVLRTVILPFEGHFVQVILDQVECRIQHLGSVPDIDGFAEQQRASDVFNLPTIDIPVTRFTLAQGEPDRCSLVIRLSHTQFDGYSLPVLWHDLKCLYEGIPLSPPSDMSSHVTRWIRSQREESFDFWRNVLDRAEVSTIDPASLGHRDPVSSPETAQFITASCNVRQTTALPHPITPATLAKAAWSYLLSRLSNADDVVFTQYLNGRSDPSESNILGMCLNYVPVRISLDPGWTVLDLMECLQLQHTQSLEYELVDFRAIVDRSTPWPKGTVQQSNLLHQNIDPDVPFCLGSARAWITLGWLWPNPPDQVLVETKPMPNDELQISIDTLSQILTQQRAEWVVKKLGDLIMAFAQSPGMRLADIDI
jgi:amino acid adenylation domain-containing protein